LAAADRARKHVVPTARMCVMLPTIPVSPGAHGTPFAVGERRVTLSNAASVAEATIGTAVRS
jgi:hypothetical protein